VIHHFSHDIGWPITLIALGIFAICWPALLAWVRWEIRLYGRSLRRARIIDTRDHRFGAHQADILDDPFVRSTVKVLDALDDAFALARAENVVSFDRRRIGA